MYSTPEILEFSSMLNALALEIPTKTTAEDRKEGNWHGDDFRDEAKDEGFQERMEKGLQKSWN